MDFTTEIKRLQKLSCIALSPKQEQKLWKQLTDIIGFLWQLPETKAQNSKRNEIESRKAGQKAQSDKLTLRTIKGVKQDQDGKKLMKNVKHGVVNNSIVIKSVLS